MTMVVRRAGFAYNDADIAGHWSETTRPSVIFPWLFASQCRKKHGAMVHLFYSGHLRFSMFKLLARSSAQECPHGTYLAPVSALIDPPSAFEETIIPAAGSASFDQSR